MDRDTEYGLIRAAQYAGDDPALQSLANEARAELIEQHRRGIWKIVRRTRSRYETPDDLYQWGVLKFINVIAKFDCDRGTRLSTLAYMAVRRFLHQMARKHGPVWIPQGAKDTDPQAYEQACAPMTSLSDGNNGELFGGQFHTESLESIVRSDDMLTLQRALHSLPENFERVMRLRLDGETLDKIGWRLRLSRQRISQIEHSSIAKMADFFAKLDDHK